MFLVKKKLSKSLNYDLKRKNVIAEKNEKGPIIFLYSAASLLQIKQVRALFVESSIALDRAKRSLSNHKAF